MPSVPMRWPKTKRGDRLLEFNQRSSVVGLHPGGTTDIQKVIMSRRIGIGRNVKEEAGRLR